MLFMVYFAVYNCAHTHSIQAHISLYTPASDTYTTCLLPYILIHIHVYYTEACVQPLVQLAHLIGRKRGRGRNGQAAKRGERSQLCIKYCIRTSFFCCILEYSTL